ncbi:28S ribosomal protein S29, mitochondrial-like isoform X1 [Biomphalaria glabrata]|uniref:Small ribosomal subunit protein mS29 n=2 Tax=Biomphalaria glabrata TaxID=6526 RepID=A0A9U8EKH0_BIOGL|nr:28S ribosomal protein S29, mitochondrial-like isoform X1 [Biomphalaria glabrata]KAI8792535.1 28S ribosomal protein S29, mitochondrial [Biomphalaria glabrata]
MEPVVLRNIVSRTLSFKFKKSPLQGFSKCKARCLSTSAQPQPEKINNVCRTHENDPRNHTLDHVGLYYTIPVEEINGVLKNCVHPWHLRLMNTFNEYGMMVRKPAVELNGYIQNVNLNHPIPRFVLYGRTGAGKASILLHTMQRFHRDGWLILSVPWAGRWVRGWYKEVSESTYKAGRYDLPTDGAEWLAHFKHQNEGKLANLKTTSEYIWTKRENAAVGTPIEEIINFGQTRIKFSSDCVGVILKEIRNQAQTLGLKVLVVVNAVNAFYTQWNQLNALKNSGKKKLHPSEISLIHNFKKMLTPTWTNGVAVCTVEEACNNLNERENYTPLYLLKQEGFEALDPFVPILVPEYTEKEALSTINYYIEHNWIQNAHGRTEEGKKEIIFVSNNNPFKLYQVCTSL